MRIIDTKLVFCLALGSLAILTGCPAQSACPPCFVGGVMAPGATKPNPDARATVNLQLGSSYKSWGPVSEVRVTVSDANGNSETVTYGSAQVGSLSSSTMLTIPDNEVYAVGDKAPHTAEVEIVFANGRRATDTMEIKPEK